MAALKGTGFVYIGDGIAAGAAYTKLHDDHKTIEGIVDINRIIARKTQSGVTFGGSLKEWMGCNGKWSQLDAKVLYQTKEVVSQGMGSFSYHNVLKL